MVSVDGSTAAEATIELSKDGVLLPQAQSTGTTLGFTCLVQVPTSNSNCCCASPTLLQVVNTGAEAVFDSINVVVTKLC